MHPPALFNVYSSTYGRTVRTDLLIFFSRSRSSSTLKWRSADDGAVFHLDEMLGTDDVDVAGQGDEDVPIGRP